MANDVAGNPLLLDTAAAANVISGSIQIYKICWEPIAIGDQVVLKNGEGRIIFDKTVHQVGTANNFVMPEFPDSDFVPPLITNGLAITTLSTSNKCKVYYTGPQPKA